MDREHVLVEVKFDTLYILISNCDPDSMDRIERTA